MNSDSINNNKNYNLDSASANINARNNMNSAASAPADDPSIETISTKQRILYSAATLFAAKGFTETSIRELASASGLQGSSIYNHYESKTAILEYMLADYVEHNSGAFFTESARKNLEEDHTTDGILACHQLTFSSDRPEYYFKVLSMIMQEQHRNPVVSEYVRGNIMQAEDHTEIIITILKDLKVLKPDTDPEFWKKLVSCIFYTYSNRAILGNGDASPDFKGLGMVDLLRKLYDTLFFLCGTDEVRAGMEFK